MIHMHTFVPPCKDIIGLMAVEEDGKLIALYPSTSPATTPQTSLLASVEIQISEYFLGERFEFDLPLAPKGTDFRRRVWDSLLLVPYGKTCSYEDLASACGDIKAVRAVGSAMKKNPIMLIIPCHRVIRKDGGIGGYEYGTDLKHKLLELESKYKKR